MRGAGFAAFALNGCLLISSVGAADMGNLAARFNDFGFNLVQDLETPEKRNLLISPASVEMALGMAYAGATGETADAISHTLGFNSGSRAAALQDLAAFQRTLEEPEQGATLKVANAIWIDESIRLNDEFLPIWRRSRTRRAAQFFSWALLATRRSRQPGARPTRAHHESNLLKSKNPGPVSGPSITSLHQSQILRDL
jgi:hypothetical protein